MAELKKYDITTEYGYETTILLSDEDAKTRGLLGKDTESVAQLKAEAAQAADAEAEAAYKAAAEAAAKEAAEQAAAEAAEKEAAEKAAQAPQNKQARPAPATSRGAFP